MSKVKNVLKSGKLEVKHWNVTYQLTGMYSAIFEQYVGMHLTVKCSLKTILNGKKKFFQYETAVLENDHIVTDDGVLEDFVVDIVTFMSDKYYQTIVMGGA